MLSISSRLRWRQDFPQIHQYPNAIVHCVTTQKNVICDQFLQICNFYLQTEHKNLRNCSFARPIWNQTISTHSSRTGLFEMGVWGYKDQTLTEQGTINFMAFEICTAVTMKTHVLSNISPCRLILVHRRFEGKFCLHHHGKSGMDKYDWAASLKSSLYLRGPTITYRTSPTLPSVCQTLIVKVKYWRL
jgi:hypothetical protein